MKDVYKLNVCTSGSEKTVMQKKLTLRMEKDVIERAKAYAKERGISVSKLVENYFAALTASESGNGEKDQTLPPITRRLANRSPASDVDEADYYRYLEEKYR